MWNALILIWSLCPNWSVSMKIKIPMLHQTMMYTLLNHLTWYSQEPENDKKMQCLLCRHGKSWQILATDKKNTLLQGIARICQDLQRCFDLFFL